MYDFRQVNLGNFYGLDSVNPIQNEYNQVSISSRVIREKGEKSYTIFTQFELTNPRQQIWEIPLNFIQIFK